VWRKKHVKFNGNKATIKYTGKSGVDHTKTVDDPKVVKVLKEFTKDKSGDDFVFDCGDEDDTCVRAKDVNDYLSKFDTTAKDIRGYHANRLMQETLKDLRKKGKKLPDDKKKREELLKEEFDKALEIVAGEVGHEAATLKSNYLVPALEDTYMDGGKVIDKLDKKKSAAMKTARNLTLARYVAQRYMRKSRTSTRNLNELLDANHVYMGPLDEGMVEAMDAAGVDESILSLMRDRINDRNGN
jgi:DNA topoisomerase IB